MRFPVHGAWVMHRASLVVAGILVFELLGSSAMAEQRVMNVWYRSVEGCPAGPDFIGRVASKGVPARLAGVGDSIDFVVTLGAGSTGSTGLLERQTSEGIVAVRTVEGDTCDQVANALAFSLALAAEGTAPQPRPAPSATAVTPPAAAPAAEVPMASVVHQGNTATARKPPAAPSARPPAARSIEWSVGARGTLTTGVSPSILPGGALFVEAGRLTGFGSSLRFSIAAGTTSNDVGANTFQVSIVEGLLEGCPATLGSALRLTGCAALGLGVMATSGAGRGGSSDSAVWSAAAVHTRLVFHPGGPVAFEAQVGAIAPLTRYEIGVGEASSNLYRTAPIGFAAGVGATVQIP